MGPCLIALASHMLTVHQRIVSRWPVRIVLPLSCMRIMNPLITYRVRVRKLIFVGPVEGYCDQLIR